MAQHRLIVLRAGGLGDSILALPAIEALGRQFQDAQLEVIGQPAFWEPAGALVHRSHAADDPVFASLYGSRADDALCDYLRNADRFISWSTHDPRGALRRCRISVTHVSPYPPPGVHAAAWLLHSVREDSVHGLPEPFALTPTPEHGRWAQSWLESNHLCGPLILHPGAGARWKCWPASGFATVARAARERGVPVLVVEGPADGAPVQNVLDLSSEPLRVLRESSPARLAAVLGKGRAFLGNDSGVTHLASVTGVPTVALFGPTDPLNWSPVGHNTSVLRVCESRTSMQGVIRACKNPSCMGALTVEHVLSELETCGVLD